MGPFNNQKLGYQFISECKVILNLTSKYRDFGQKIPKVKILAGKVKIVFQYKLLGKGFLCLLQFYRSLEYKKAAGCENFYKTIVL